MPNPTGLDEDLAYLRIKHSIDSSLVRALTESPHSARKYLQSHKIVAYIVCPLFMLLGLTIIVLAFLLPISKLVVFSGMVGAIMLYYFANDFLKKLKAVREIERIASYHGLL